MVDAAARTGYRVTSAAFKHVQLVPPPGWRNSVDWEDRGSLLEERRLVKEEHPGWGIGALTYAVIDADAQARVEDHPLPDNPAHCLLFVLHKRAAARLAKECDIVDLPTMPISQPHGDL